MTDIEQGLGTTVPAPQIQQEPQSIFQRSSNPMALIFLLLFRSLAIFFYVMGDLIFANNASLTFVMIILMLSFDFWTVSMTMDMTMGMKMPSSRREYEDESISYLLFHDDLEENYFLLMKC